MKNLLALLLLIPSLSWALDIEEFIPSSNKSKTVLECKAFLYSEIIGDIYLTFENNNENLKYLTEKGDEVKYEFLEQNEVFIKFESGNNKNKLVLNKYTLEMELSGYVEGEKITSKYQCNRMHNKYL